MTFPDLAVAPGWEVTRLDRVASVQARIGWKALTADEYVDEGYAFLSTPNIKSSKPDFVNVNFIDEFRFRESPNLALREGDVLLAKDGSTLGICNVVTELPRPATVNGSIAILRPHDINSRFLRYFIQGDYIQQRIQLVKDGMGVPHLFQRDIKRFPVARPALDEQRRIADFLDDQVARIDEVIRLRREQVSTVRERSGMLADRLVADAQKSGGWVRLKYSSDLVTVGIVITPAAWYADEGVPALRGTNVKPEAISLDDLVYLSEEGHRLHRKSQLRSGDVVVVRTGQAGAAAVVPESLAGINAIDILIIRPSVRLNSEFLAMCLNAPITRELTNSTVVGAIQGHFNVGTLRDVLIPNIGVSDQGRVAKQWVEQRDCARQAIAVMESQVSLMKERKRSLITAAVAGQFDVSR